MAGRGRGRRQRGSSSRQPPSPPPTTPDAGHAGPAEDEFVEDDEPISPPATRSSAAGATPRSSLPSASTPTTYVAPPGANPFPGLMVVDGVYVRRPGFADPPTLPERPPDIRRTELWADGSTFFPREAATQLGELMRSYFHGPYINFSDIPDAERYTWLNMLRKFYWWPEHREPVIRKCYKTIASKRLRDMVNDQKALATLPGDRRKPWLSAEFWEEMKKKMDNEKYKAKSAKAKAARAKGGLHTGGSIPTAEHFRRMCEEAIKAGEDPKNIDFPAIFQRTHKRKKDGTLVDQRATQALERFETLEGEGETSSPRTPAVRNDLWVQAVGRGKDGSVYGTGSLASQPSVISRPPPPPSQPAPGVPSGAMTLEQLTTIVLELQRSIREMAEGRTPAAPAPAPATPTAAPTQAATAAVPPAPTGTAAPPAPEDLQQIISMVMTQYMASRSPPPPPPPPST